MFTYYLMISISIATWLYYKQINKKNRIIYGFIITFLFLICITTAIRKAIFIPIIFWFAYVFIISINRRRLIGGILKVILSIALILIGYSLLMYNEYFASTVGRRMEGFIAGVLGTGESDNSFNIRMLLIKSAIESFMTYPIFGYGFGAFRDYADNMINIRLYAHNNYLELLASSGIIGFIIYYGIVILIFKKLYIRFKKLGNVMFAFGIALIISLLANDFAVVSYLSLPYMTILSILACLCKISIDNNTENISDEVRFK
ncbi:O-antigen ligase family protein [Paenibacillus sp. JSM ZJ436]|uniref:O-antigen ligase family protein n=1 Tax=Paenibacillus sp. JSM ZJ436 TaxID=3376190 RepID=UPI0037A817DF